MEANTEVYHVRSIHPKTVYPILDDRRNVNTLYPNGHGRMVAPAPKGIGDPRAMRMPTAAEIETVGEIGRTCTQSYGVFPNWVSPLSQRALPPAPVLAERHRQVPAWKPGPWHRTGAKTPGPTCGP